MLRNFSRSLLTVETLSHFLDNPPQRDAVDFFFRRTHDSRVPPKGNSVMRNLRLRWVTLSSKDGQGPLLSKYGEALSSQRKPYPWPISVKSDLIFGAVLPQVLLKQIRKTVICKL